MSQNRVRPEVAAALGDLRAAGVRRFALVSGDRRPVAERVATGLGLTEVAADCLPQDKVAYVQGLRRQGLRVAVVGDGVNDSPALAAGDLGIAMGAAGSEVAIKSASIALLNSDLRRLPFLLHLSRRARVAIGQNFVVGGLVLAMLGQINPVVAILLNAGSLIVIFNSARLVREGEELDTFQPAAVPPVPTVGTLVPIPG